MQQRTLLYPAPASAKVEVLQDGVRAGYAQGDVHGYAVFRLAPDQRYELRPKKGRGRQIFTMSDADTNWRYLMRGTPGLTRTETAMLAFNELSLAAKKERLAAGDPDAERFLATV